MTESSAPTNSSPVDGSPNPNSQVSANRDHKSFREIMAEFPLQEIGAEFKKIGTNIVESWKEINRQLDIDAMANKAFNLAWTKCITGKRVDFVQKNRRKEESLVWGIEVVIPLHFTDISATFEKTLREIDQKGKQILRDEDVSAQIKKHNRQYENLFTGIEGVVIPPHIKNIRVLDLMPQEALEKRWRNLKLKRSPQVDVLRTLLGQAGNPSLFRLATTGIAFSSAYNQRTRALGNLINDVMAEDPESRPNLQKILANSTAPEILCISAHGSNEWIGEQSDTEQSDPFTDTQVAVFQKTDRQLLPQKPGNWVSTKEVLTHYGRPDQFAAVLLHCCYHEDGEPPQAGVPSFRAYGSVGGAGRIDPSHAEHITKVGMSLPTGFKID